MANIVQFPAQPAQKPQERFTRRKDGLYQVTLRYTDSAGISRKKSFYGKTQSEAIQKRKAFQRDLDDGLKADDKTTVGEYADRWMATYKCNLKPGTRATYQHDVDLIKAAMGGKQLRAVTASDVQALLNTRAGLSSSAIKKTAMTVRAIFSAARRDRLILFSPCEDMTRPEGTAGSHRALSDEERQYITTHCTDHRFYMAAMVMMYAGLRRGEVMALRYEDIDLKAGLIHVTRSAHIDEDGTGYFIDAPKSDASKRDVPILPPLDRILADAPRSGLVLSKVDGTQVTESAFKRCYDSWLTKLAEDLNGAQKRWATKEQLAHWQTLDIRCHDLRHTFCTLLYDAGVDVKTAQIWMGHADVMVTMRIYTHLSQLRHGESTDAARKYFSALSPQLDDLQSASGGKSGGKTSAAPAFIFVYEGENAHKTSVST